MLNRIKLFALSPVSLVIAIGAIVKFALHLYIAPGYGFFFNELYTIALSRHLAFGYVDLGITLVIIFVSRARRQAPQRLSGGSME